VTDLQTIRRFTQTCHVFNTADASTRANVRTMIMPFLRRYRRNGFRFGVCAAVSDQAELRRHPGPKPEVRHALTEAELRMKFAPAQVEPAPMTPMATLTSSGAFATADEKNRPRKPIKEGLLGTLVWDRLTSVFNYPLATGTSTST
jgi:hypothetical protein